MIYSFVSGEVSESGDRLRMPIAKVGTLAKSPAGKLYRLTQSALEQDAGTYTGGYVNINHQIPEKGKIETSWFEGEHVWGEVSGLTDKMKQVISSAAYEGVSQESDPLEVSQTPTLEDGKEIYEVNRLRGRGVAIVLYPYKPRCPLSEGCGVVSAEVVETDDLGNPESVRFDYDVGKRNNQGSLIKVRETSVWLHGDEIGNEAKLKEYLVMETTGYNNLGSVDIFERNAALQIGDEITDATPVHSINVTVSAFNPTPDITPSGSSILRLNTSTLKIGNVPGGGVNMDENIANELKLSLEAKDTEIATLKQALADQKLTIDDLTGKYGKLEESQKTIAEVTASATLENYKKQLQMDDLFKKAAKLMSAEELERIKAVNPSAEMLSASLEIIEAKSKPKPAGAQSGFLPGDEVVEGSNTCTLKYNAVTGVME